MCNNYFDYNLLQAYASKARKQMASTKLDVVVHPQQWENLPIKAPQSLDSGWLLRGLGCRRQIGSASTWMSLWRGKSAVVFRRHCAGLLLLQLMDFIQR